MKRVPAAAMLALLAGCHVGGGTAPDWDARWPGLVSAGRGWRAGAEFVVASHEGTPVGVAVSRERWTLLRRDSIEGDFERARDGRPATVVTLPFHADVPRVPYGGGRGGVYPCVGGFVSVRVPAGRFRCGHTWRDREEPDGRVMRVDEWWAPGVPVPVQSWTRWEGVVDSLGPAPRRAADVRVGTTWAVLQSIRRP